MLIIRGGPTIASQCIDPNGGYSRSLVKLMHKQKARALARERSECVSALAHDPQKSVPAEAGADSGIAARIHVDGLEKCSLSKPRREDNFCKAGSAASIKLRFWNEILAALRSSS